MKTFWWLDEHVSACRNHSLDEQSRVYTDGQRKFTFCESCRVIYVWDKESWEWTEFLVEASNPGEI